MGCQCGKDEEKSQSLDNVNITEDFSLEWFKKHHNVQGMWNELAQARQESKEIVNDEYTSKKVSQALISKERTTKALNALFTLWVMDMIDDPKDIPVLSSIPSVKKIQNQDQCKQRIQEQIESDNQSAIQVIFDTIDEDTSGFIDKKEFTNLYGVCEKVYQGHYKRTYDKKDKSGVDDDKELITRLAIMLEKILDENHDGVVTANEMNRGLQTVAANIAAVASTWLKLAGVVVMEILNSTIDHYTSKNKKKNEGFTGVTWTGQLEDEWNKKKTKIHDKGNFVELLAHACGLFEIINNEITFKTIGEYYGLKRSEMNYAYPATGQEAEEVLKQFNHGKVKHSKFLMTIVPVGKLIELMTGLATELKKIFDTQPAAEGAAAEAADQEIDVKEFSCCVEKYFASQGVTVVQDIEKFYKDIASKVLNTEDALSPIKTEDGAVRIADDGQAPSPGPKYQKESETTTLKGILGLLRSVDAEKILKTLVGYISEQHAKLVEGLFRLFQFGNQGNSVKKSHVDVFVFALMGGVPMESLPKVVFDALDANGDGVIEPNEAKAAMKSVYEWYKKSSQVAIDSLFKFIEFHVIPAITEVLLEYVPNEAEGAAAEGAASPVEGKSIGMPSALMALSYLAGPVVEKVNKPILKFKYNKDSDDVKNFGESLRKHIKDKFADEFKTYRKFASDSKNAAMLSIFAAFWKRVEAKC
jgi:Ca2+-binding EF-hand superfamily protein